MPCTKETERCASGKNLNHPTPPCCKSHVVEMFRILSGLLDDAGVTWWLDYGSLLGAVRNPMLGHPCGMIPHDKDGDCGVLGEHKDRFVSVLPALRDAGLDVVIKVARMGGMFAAGDSVKIRWSEKNHTNVDFFFWYEKVFRGQRVLYRKRYINADRFKGREFPAEWLEPIRRVTWEGLQLPVPAEAPKLVEHRYGHTWRWPIARNHDGRRR